MPEKPKLTTWERFTAKMAALGIDPLGPFVDEDDPRFDEVQAILAEFGGVAPLPPLPPHWEGRRPVDYDGTIAGISRWLDCESRQIVAQGIFPGAGQTKLSHLNEVIRNAYRAFAHFQVVEPPKRVGRATEIVVAKERIEGLAEFIQSKLKSGWQGPISDQPKEGKIAITKWADLGIGIGIGIDDNWIYYAFSPCPENGERVRLRDAMILTLAGKRWKKVLDCLALSHDGKTAGRNDLVMRLGYLKKGDVREDYARDDQLTLAKTALNKLRPTMADLGEKLRTLVITEDKTTVFGSNGDDYLAAFVTRPLLRDHDGSYSFGKAQ